MTTYEIGMLLVAIGVLGVSIYNFFSVSVKEKQKFEQISVGLTQLAPDLRKLRITDTPSETKPDDLQIEVNSLLWRGIAFSIIWLAGIGSLISISLAVKARRLIKE